LTETDGRRSARAADKALWVGTLLFRLGYSRFHILDRRRAEREAIRELIAGLGREAGEPRQVDLLFGEIVAQRNDLLLLRERPHLVLVDVELRQYALSVLLRGLMEDGIGGVELDLRGVHAGLGGQHLQISAAHRQGDELARILQAVLAGSGGGLGGTVIMKLGEVRHGLAEAGLKGEVVKRAHDVGNAEAGQRRADAQSEGGEIDLLHGFAEIAVEVR
jgi:hypothetical protein